MQKVRSHPPSVVTEERGRSGPSWTIGGIIAAIATACGVLIGMSGAWHVIEPVTPAFRGYVRDYADEGVKPLRTDTQETKKVLRDLQVESAEGKLSATEDALAKWELERQKLERQKGVPPSSVELIEKQKRELSSSKGKIEDQIRVLRSLK